MQRSVRVLVVALGALCLLAGPAPADPVLRGSVHDPRGDAELATYPGANVQEIADLKQLDVTYDQVAGTLRIVTKMWPPVPGAGIYVQVNRFNAYHDCSSSVPVLTYNVVSIPWHFFITGTGWVAIFAERDSRGNRLTQTWSDPALAQLDIGCVKEGFVITGRDILPDSTDAFEPVELR